MVSDTRPRVEFEISIDFVSRSLRLITIKIVFLCIIPWPIRTKYIFYLVTIYQSAKTNSSRTLALIVAFQNGSGYKLTLMFI